MGMPIPKSPVERVARIFCNQEMALGTEEIAFLRNFVRLREQRIREERKDFQKAEEIAEKMRGMITKARKDTFLFMALQQLGEELGEKIG